MEREIPIPITEDLMREHGILDRLLLIYERLIMSEKINSKISYQAAKLIRVFAEDYHEKMEEKYIFPLIDNEMTKILKKQHKIGRKLTDKILKISKKENLNYIDNCKLKRYMTEFTYMYRAHESREDTEIFPKVRAKISKKKFEEISEKSEEMEHRMFGEDGFNNVLKIIIEIEKKLKINDLNHYSVLKSCEYIL